MSQEDMRVFMTVMLSLGALFFLALGLACWFMDLSGMFCYYKDGGIYWVRWHTLIAEDTPKNRKRLSSACGAIWLLLGGISLLGLFFLWWG